MRGVRRRACCEDLGGRIRSGGDHLGFFCIEAGCCEAALRLTVRADGLRGWLRLTLGDFQGLGFEVAGYPGLALGGFVAVTVGLKCVGHEWSLATQLGMV